MYCHFAYCASPPKKNDTSIQLQLQRFFFVFFYNTKRVFTAHDRSYVLRSPPLEHETALINSFYQLMISALQYTLSSLNGDIIKYTVLTYAVSYLYFFLHIIYVINNNMLHYHTQASEPGRLPPPPIFFLVKVFDKSKLPL